MCVNSTSVLGMFKNHGADWRDQRGVLRGRGGTSGDIAGLRMTTSPRENGYFSQRPAGLEEGPGLASPGDGNTSVTMG